MLFNHVDEVASWWNGMLMKGRMSECKFDEMVSWQNGKSIRVELIARKWNDKFIKYQIDEMIGLWNGWLIKWWVDKLSSWWNGKFAQL